MRERRVLWAVTGVVAAGTAGMALRRPPEVQLTDLSVYLGAVSGLADGASLYDFARGAAPFTYPPFAALLFTPLTWLPLPLVQVGWTLATLAVILGLARLAAREHPAAALILVLSAPVTSNLRFGQVSLLLAALVTVDLLALRRTPWQGALIGLAAAIKLTPLIFIPLLWCAGRRTAAAVATATFAGGGLIGALTLPGDSWRFWGAEVFHVSRLGYITSVGNQSLNGALMRLEIATPVRSLLVLVAGGAVAVLALRRAARLARAGEWLAAAAVTGAASVVLSPVSWTHHQIWLVAAALLPVRGPAWCRPAWTVAVLAVMVLPVTALGPPVWSEARLLLALAVAAVVPLAGAVREEERQVARPGRDTSLAQPR